MDGQAVGEKRQRKRIRVAGRFGGVDQTVRGRHRIVSGTGNRQSDDQARPGECVGVADRARAERDTTRIHRSGWPTAT